MKGGYEAREQKKLQILTMKEKILKTFKLQLTRKQHPIQLCGGLGSHEKGLAMWGSCLPIKQVHTSQVVD